MNLQTLGVLLILYDLIFNHVFVSAVKTTEISKSELNQSEALKTALQARNARRSARRREKVRIERALVKEVLTGDQSSNNRATEIDLNKPPPIEKENPSAQFSVLESSSISLHDKKEERKKVKMDPTKLLEWSKAERDRLKVAQRERRRKIDPAIRSAQSKKWKETQKKKLKEGVSRKI